MPKGFTESEKERIVIKLREEGQKLFVKHGLKKVTIESLASAAHIAKGSFYTFYKTKEDLFLDISHYYQQKLFDEMATVLTVDGCTDTEKMFNFLKGAFTKMKEYPLLGMIDAEVVEHLYRKSSHEKIEEELQMDILRASIFDASHIQFNYDLSVVVKLLQKVMIAAIQNNEDEDAAFINEIMFMAIAEKVVK